MAAATLVSVSPYSQSKYHKTEAIEKESKADWENRTWRERLNVNEAGQVFIPPMAFKNCLSDAAQYLSQKIQGKRNATYTKHFKAGVIVTDPLVLPIAKDQVAGQVLFVPADGKRGSGSRVERIFPLITSWRGEVIFHILDDTITKDVFAYHLEQAGRFIGIGRFRPQNNGYYGRFNVEKLEWVKV